MVVHDINLSEYEKRAYSTKIKHALSPYVRKDCHVYLMDNRSYSNAATDDIISSKMREFDNDYDVAPGNKIVVVNMGWHHSDPNFPYSNISESNLYKEIKTFWRESKKIFFFDSVFSFNKNMVENEEHVAYDDNEELAMMSLRVHPDGYYVLYLMWDFMQVEESDADGEIPFFSYWMNKLVKTACVEPIFYKKFSKLYKLKMKEPKPVYSTKSIKEVAESIANSEESLNQILEEMVSKALDKNFINCLMSVVFRYRKVNITEKMAHDYLMHWARAKWPIYLMLGRELRVKDTVKQVPDKKMRMSIVSEICHKFPQYALIIHDFSSDEIFRNRVSSNNHKISEYCGNVVPGKKFTKCMSEICNDEKFDVALSSIYQDKECAWNMYISIHPMDYFTSSSSKSGWHSCHNAWDGIYSNAVSSLMFDEASVVAYACDDNEYEYEYNSKSFKWNSKSWRQMVNIGVCQNSAIFNREYPQDYNNTTFSGCIKNNVKNLITNFCSITGDWFEDVKDGGCSRKSFEKYYALGKGSSHYNDIPARKTTFVTPRNRTNEFYKKIIIGGNGYCPICGRRHDNSGRIICNSCI